MPRCDLAQRKIREHYELNANAGKRLEVKHPISMELQPTDQLVSPITLTPKRPKLSKLTCGLPPHGR